MTSFGFGRKLVIVSFNGKNFRLKLLMKQFDAFEKKMFNSVLMKKPLKLLKLKCLQLLLKIAPRNPII